MRSADITADVDHILQNINSIIGNFKNKRIFISGGTGFIGSWLLETFAYANDKLDLNTQIFVLSRNADAFFNKAPHFYFRRDFVFLNGNLLDFKFNEAKFDYFIHAAAEASTDLNQRDPLLMFKTIVNGTQHLLEYATESIPESFLYISSGAVYGSQPSEISHISEDYTGAPSLTDIYSSYGEGKRAAEILCSIYSKMHNFPIKIARCFTLLGPYMPLDQHLAIGNFIGNLIDQGPIIIKGDGTAIRSYLYISDVIIWLLTILIKGKNCTPYNVGSEEAISIKGLAELIAGLSDKILEIKFLSKSHIGKVNRYVPSTRLAREDLNLTQIISLEEGIKKTRSAYIK